MKVIDNELRGLMRLNPHLLVSRLVILSFSRVQSRKFGVEFTVNGSLCKGLEDQILVRVSRDMNRAYNQ